MCDCEKQNQNMTLSLIFSYFIFCLSLMAYMLGTINNMFNKIEIKQIKYHDDSSVNETIEEIEENKEE